MNYFGYESKDILRKETILYSSLDYKYIYNPGLCQYVQLNVLISKRINFCTVFLCTFAYSMHILNEPNYWKCVQILNNQFNQSIGAAFG